MNTHLTNGAANGVSNGTYPGVSLQEIPKSHTFTAILPPDPEFETPSDSHRAPRGYVFLEHMFSLLDQIFNFEPSLGRFYS